MVNIDHLTETLIESLDNVSGVISMPLFIVAPIVSWMCCVWSLFAVQYFVSLLVLQSSRWGRGKRAVSLTFIAF